MRESLANSRSRNFALGLVESLLKDIARSPINDVGLVSRPQLEIILDALSVWEASRPLAVFSINTEMAQLAAKLLSRASFEDNGDKVAAKMVRRAFEVELSHVTRSGRSE